MPIKGAAGLVVLGLIVIAFLRLHLVQYFKTAWVLAWHDMGMRSV